MTDRSLTPTEPEKALELYLKERRTEVAESTLQSQQYRLNHFVGWCNDVAGIDDTTALTGRDLHEYKLWRQEDGNLNPVSLKGQMDTLRVFIRFCESIDAAEPDLHAKVMSPTLTDGVGQRDVKLESGEAKAILDYLSRFEYASFAHVLTQLLWRTGLRSGSVRAIDVDDYDPEGECMAVRHRPETDTPLKNKSNGERLVALNPETCSMLTAWIDHQRPDVTDEYGRRPLLASGQGRASKNMVRSTIYRWTCPCQYRGECPHDRSQEDCEALGRKMNASKCPSSVSPHAVRRGSITHHLTEDVPEQVVSDRMNVSQRILDEHYDRRSEQVKVEQRREYLDDV